ncbi:glycosyltransferase family 39 protein [uncultured Dokdonia sp.]|uniref:ArnT family glycosyltransferase n=1 Tax=uncultured Dokdonia sp. TaxID=575653 RepID=UPI0026229082|nr:glycosyltransferase family 39 protein [uncultured Dokdonia sp.]
MIDIYKKRPILTIITLVALLLLPFLDVMEVTIMEARNFITAREMLTDDHWILTTMNGEARYQKPPLPTWLTAISAMLFGVKSIWGLRLPAVLMVMLLGIMLYTLSRKLTLDKSHSLYNGLIGVTSLYIILIVFEAPWDIYAHAFMLVAIYGIVQLFKNDTISWGYGLLAVLGIGCSVLSKGPVSAYALLLPFLISYGIIFRKSTTTKKWVLFVGVLIVGLVIGFSWYLYVRYADPETFAAIASKETGNWTSYNVRPFYYYWSFFTQSGLWTVPAFIGLLYPYLKTRVSNLKVYQFTLLWTLLVVVLLSVIPEKKSRYLMPVLIPLAMNTGFYIEYLIRRFKELKDKRETIPVYFFFGILGLAFIGIAIAIIYLSLTETTMRIPVITYFFVGVLVSIGVLLCMRLYQKSIGHVLIITIIGLIMLVYSAGSLRKQHMITNPAYANFEMLQEKGVLEKGIPYYSYQRTTPEIIWSKGGTIPVIYHLNDIEEDAFYIIAPHEYEHELTLKKNQNTKGYTVVTKTPLRIDVNAEPSDARSHKDRKIGYVYKLVK